MTTTVPSESPSPSPAPHGEPGSHAAPEAPAAPVDQFASPVPVANAALVGVPTFMVGSLALGFNLAGFFGSNAVAGPPIAIVLMATGLGQLIATIFALKAGESAVACVFGIFTGFWLSYGFLVIGITKNFFGLGPAGTDEASTAAFLENVANTQKTFLLAWLVLIVILTLVSLRLPLAFTLLFVLVDLALLFVYLGVANANEGTVKVGGYLVLSFVVAGAYLFADAMSAATGGKNLPLGRPIIK